MNLYLGLPLTFVTSGQVSFFLLHFPVCTNMYKVLLNHLVYPSEDSVSLLIQCLDITRLYIRYFQTTVTTMFGEVSSLAPMVFNLQ